MLLEYKIGNLLEFDEDCVAHCANCQSTMGSGVALALKNKWPEVYYIDRNDKRSRQEKLGSFSKTILQNGGRYCYNIYGQFDYKGRQHGEMDLNYLALASGLMAVRGDMIDRGLKSIAMPMIGAGLAGGDWKKIEEIINNTFGKTDIEVTIYKLKQ